MKLGKYLAKMAGLACAALIVTSSGASAATISIACDSVGNAAQICRDGAEAWAKKTGNTIKLVSVPTSGSERLALYQQLLSTESASIDVFMIDVVWPGILSGNFVDLTKPAAQVIGEHFPAVVGNNTVNGRLIAMPWFIDGGLLYYRKDLLEKYGATPPTTWEEMRATASRIQDSERKAGNTRMWGYVWQGKSYEGLTCNAIEWISSYRGGTIVDDSGKVTINNPGAITALKMAKSWIGTISPKGVLSYGEEEARGVFQSGNAVFMRNWPYAWAAANNNDSPVKNKVGIAPLPKGGPDGVVASALGGQQLAVSRYSRNVDAAVDLVLYLTGRDEQKRRAIVGSYNPTIPSLYQDREILATNPFQGALYDVFANATARPSTVTLGKYNQVSAMFWNTVGSVIGDDNEPEVALKSLDAKLRRLSSRGKWK